MHTLRKFALSTSIYEDFLNGSTLGFFEYFNINDESMLKYKSVFVKHPTLFIATLTFNHLLSHCNNYISMDIEWLKSP